MTEDQFYVERRVTVMASWQLDDAMAYLQLTGIRDGGAARQISVNTPGPLASEIVLDFDKQGRLLGIEFFDPKVLPMSHED
ncbi:MAG TPA: DUF2283 domain-containing protein [Microbacterium sp.]|nr:DUF2283 domain-containing protein [Microbacterium sp.]